MNVDMFTIGVYNYILLIKIKCKKLLKDENYGEIIFTIIILYSVFGDDYL